LIGGDEQDFALGDLADDGAELMKIERLRRETKVSLIVPLS